MEHNLTSIAFGRLMAALLYRIDWYNASMWFDRHTDQGEKRMYDSARRAVERRKGSRP